MNYELPRRPPKPPKMTRKDWEEMFRELAGWAVLLVVAFVVLWIIGAWLNAGWEHCRLVDC